jgi:signal transduction histidine kinase
MLHCRNDIQCGSNMWGASTGSRVISPELIEVMKSNRTEGVYRAITPIDGAERTVAFVRSPLYPIYTLVGLGAREYLAPWKNEVKWVLGLQLLVLILTALTGQILEQMYSAREKEVAIREEFLNIASHELRTPMTPLLMQVELLQRR